MSHSFCKGKEEVEVGLVRLRGLRLADFEQPPGRLLPHQFMQAIPGGFTQTWAPTQQGFVDQRGQEG